MTEYKLVPHEPDHIPDAGKKVGRPQVREVFLRNGARIESDRDDLPDYVYEAAFELLEMAAPAVQEEPDSLCVEGDGCPPEMAVMKRFWREHQPDQSICDFYEATDYPSLVRELVGHVKQLQEAAMRNVKPWEDTFPPTLLPSYIKRIENADAEHQPEPVVAGLVEALEGVLDGRPLDTEFWDRCEQFIAAHRKGGNA